jgi:hypothetical protein
MSLVSIAEVFGHPTGDFSPAATKARKKKWCPFREGPCNKGSLSDPLGICSFGDEKRAGAVCPNRFLEGDRVFADAGKVAFGRGVELLIAPEIRILELPGRRVRKIGKVDFILGRLGRSGNVVDFAALEVQAVYFSGKSIKDSFHRYMKSGKVPSGSERRLDYRSSAQKRLMPQLNLKVPVFRRWGKRFFVAVDELFFESLPIPRTVDTIDNSEVTWLVYPLAKGGRGYTLGEPKVHFTLWEDVLAALREGKEPTPAEIMGELTQKRSEFRTIGT